MKQFSVAILLAALSSFFPIGASARCEVRQSTGAVASGLSDALAVVLASATLCPTHVLQLRALLQENGLASVPSMVANRGIHNPRMGSFSFFERVGGRMPSGMVVGDGEFFFGHFTGATNGQLVLDQEPADGKLMIELIAWDPRKGLYNFYELIGQAQGGIWFYRGDSADILADNRFLHQEGPMSPPKFGSRLRCSACHASGGPIMKELAPPHNDWWTIARPLPLAPNKPDAQVTGLMKTLQDAGSFSRSVHIGMTKLENSPTYLRLKASRSLAEELRPLFCENEINLASSPAPANQSGMAIIPSGFFMSPWLAGMPLQMPMGTYKSLMSSYGLQFPENGAPDADHAWLTPVRSYRDEMAIVSLLRQGRINEEFVLDVMAVDAENPLFSVERCGLLPLLPKVGGGTPMSAWLPQFVKLLSNSGFASAKILEKNLTDPNRNAAFFRKFASQRMQALQASLATPAGAKAAFEKLLALRAKTFRAKISQNPRGQILEPGFRVIFPVPR